MTQSRTMSGVETVANVAIGFVLAFLMTLFILPHLYGPGTGSALLVTGFYTAISLCRGYIVRRVFNAL